ncbi:MAG: hypothetical protein NTZ90_18840 [Proteobacteria bacterium]|nr:hypothetical protein [Pseudomonadota bacterium]
MTKILFTGAYAASLESIEDFIYESTRDLAVLTKFLDEHDRTVQFIADSPDTPAVHPATGDQSWPFGDGRYRLFFKTVRKEGQAIVVYMTHIIDNRKMNLDIYPSNTLPTYQED